MPAERERAFDIRLNNLLDVTYANYLNAACGADVNEEGFNAKLAATVRFGG
jgi:hypothetical protein